MTKKIAVYAGTFDPVTLGHLDVIQRALKIFDQIIVAVATSPEKKPFFSLDERVSLLEQATEKMESVTIESFEGLLVDFVKKKGSKIVLRGLRELSDFEFEFQQAVVNRKLSPEIDSVFIMTDARFFYVSSSMVKEIASHKGCVDNFVPLNVKVALEQKFRK